MQPNWTDLQAFLWIARAGQMSRASAGAGVNATTLSRRLRRLEARLGRRLFEQTRQGQLLTEAGEQLLAEVEAMEQAAERILETRGGAAGGVSGLLRVSVSEGFGTHFIAQRIAGFLRDHPALHIDLAASSGFLSPSRREADVAVLLARPRTGPVNASKLTDYLLRPYASRDYVARHGAPASIADLAAAHPLIGYIPDLLYAPELRYMDELDQRLSPTVRSTSINAQHELVAASAGIAILPAFIADQDPRLVPVLPDAAITRSFWLVTHRDTHGLQRIRTFREWLVAMVRAHQDQLLGRATQCDNPG